MGSSSSCLSSVAPLNAPSADDEPDQGLLEKLVGQPALLSKPIPGLCLLLGGAGQTWLHVACERKQLQTVQRLCDFLAGSPLDTVRDALGPYCRRTGLPLPGSVTEGLRLAVGMCNGKGQTPLMHACYAGCPQLVRYLLEQGANPWASDRCGSRTALHYATISGCTGSVAALMRSTTAVQLLPGGSRYVDVKTLSGMTALHYAVLYERQGVLVELLRHDPHLHMTTSSGGGSGNGNGGAGGGCGGGGASEASWLESDWGATPLHFAAARGNAVCVLELLRHYAARQHTGLLADPRLSRNSAGQQPWQLAVALHPAQRYLAMVLQPGRPLPRMGAGGEEGVQVVALGPPSLAAIAAAALRQKLLATVEAAEAQVAAAATAAEAAAQAEARTIARGAECGQDDAGWTKAASGSRELRHMATWSAGGAWCNGRGGRSGGGGGRKLPGGSGAAATAAATATATAAAAVGARGGAAPACHPLTIDLGDPTPRCLSAGVISVQGLQDHLAGAAAGGGDAGRGAESAPAGPLPPAANSIKHHHNQQHHLRYPTHHHHNDRSSLQAHQHNSLHALVSSRLLIRTTGRDLPEGCAGRCCRLQPLEPRLHPFGIPELPTDNNLTTVDAGAATEEQRLRNGSRGDARAPLLPCCVANSVGGAGGGCCGGGSCCARRRDTIGECSPVSGCFRPGMASRPSVFRRRALSAVTTVRMAGPGATAAGGCNSGGGGHGSACGVLGAAGVAHWSSLVDFEVTAVRVRDLARPGDATAPSSSSTAVAAVALTTTTTTALAFREEDEEEGREATETAEHSVSDAGSGCDGGSGGGGGSICNVCYSRHETLAPAGCGHGLCAACARELCHGVASRPLPCPFCRRPVTDFVPLSTLSAAVAGAGALPLV